MSATKIVLAKLSPTMEEGIVVKWHKHEGDVIKVGDVLAEIETDKANMEMEALAAGVLRKVLVPTGGKAPVGALIGIIADPADDISALLAQAQAAAPTPAAVSPAQPAQPHAMPDDSQPPLLRETAVNTYALSRSLAVATTLLAAAPALAEQFGPLEVLGFLKNEYSLCDNCSSGLVNRASDDPRGVLIRPTPW